jgi:hypothetical protein
MTEGVFGDEAIVLSSEELLLLRFSTELTAEEESPFGALEPNPDAEVLQKSARALVERQLADAKTFRPHREVIRRLLIVAQPDSRIVLLRAGPGQGERLLDLYERAGAFVSYSRHGEKHRFGPPLELVDVLDEIIAHFPARASTGDFIELQLESAEHFALNVLAAELAARRREGSNIARVGVKPPMRSDSHQYEPSLEGAIVLPSKRLGRAAPRIVTEVPRLVLPNDEQWHAALVSLAKKGVVIESQDGFELRPFLHDFAHGVATQNRHVLTRFDFGGDDWIVRDATFIPVPGSVFLLRATPEGGLHIRELDRAGLEDAVKRAVSELHTGDTLT